jgi:hypothetical protein
MPKRNGDLTVKRTNSSGLGKNLYEDKELGRLINVDAYIDADLDAFEKMHWLLRYAFVIFVILTLVAIVVGMWWFSKFIQVNSDTGLSILIRVCCVLAASVLLIKTRLTSNLGIVPIMFFGIVWSFYPALNYWLHAS